MTEFPQRFGPMPQRSDKLGRYYTRLDIGSELVNQMTGLRPSKLLDLGAGAGSLSRAAAARWKDVQILTVDIDARAQSHLSKLLGATRLHAHHHIKADALSSKLPRLISARAQHIDTGVCNPPFITPQWRRGFAEILEDAGFSGCIPVLCEVDAALIFLAQNLRVLSETATLGIILPDTLISGAKYRHFRQELLKRYLVHRTVRLPRGSFQGTDALAHIVVISKGAPTEGRISLQNLTSSALRSASVFVEVDQAIDRLDFGYHVQNIAQRGLLHDSRTALGDVADVSRGLLSTTTARQAQYPVIHTTDLDCAWLGTWREFRGHSSEIPKTFGGVTVRPGDILLARVGRNLEKKVVGVSAGRAVLTDCVYRIRVPETLRQLVLHELTTNSGQAWLQSRTYGVSAKQISKSDLLLFPLSLRQSTISQEIN